MSCHSFCLSISAVALFSLVGYAADQTPGPSTPASDESTVMLLQPQAEGLKDKTGAFVANVNGGTIVTDARFGHALRFGEEERNGISVPDGGKIDFSRGMTLEMWLQLEQPDEKMPHLGGSLFVKMGSFYTTIRGNRFNVDWMTFPNDTVVTTTETQYRYYPVSGTGFPGYIDIPVNRWAHVALTYDPVLKVARSWIDDKLDWTEYYPREGAMPLQNNVNNVLSFVAGMKSVRVGEIRVSNVARAIETLTPFETYVHALPYRNKSAVIVEHIDSSTLPLDVVLQSDGKLLLQFSLTDPKTKTLLFDPPVSKSQYALTIKATSSGKEVYSRNVDLYAGDDSKQPVNIDDKNRLVINGKPVFPLMVYHTFMEDVPVLAKTGFNLFSARYPDNEGLALPTRDDKTIAIARQFLELAKANEIFVVANGGIFAAGGGSTEINTKGIGALTNDPALAIWYGADEPGRTRIRQLQDGYTSAKQITTRPIFSLTNRADHMPGLAETADILGSDPYPIPNISLRRVADFTKYCVNATAGLKPVWTVIPQYQYYEKDNKRPTEQELRCMAYLAITSGAQGLGIYAWDDRNAITKKGWYTKEHPEDLSILKTVIGELNKLEDVLIIPNSTRVLTLTPDNPAIHVAMKDSGKESYLFVVSDSRAAEEATLSIAGLQSADGVDVHDAHQNVSIRAGKVHLQLPPLGTRIYKLTNIQSGG